MFPPSLWQCLALLLDKPCHAHQLLEMNHHAGPDGLCCRGTMRGCRSREAVAASRSQSHQSKHGPSAARQRADQLQVLGLNRCIDDEQEPAAALSYILQVHEAEAGEILCNRFWRMSGGTHLNLRSGVVGQVEPWEACHSPHPHCTTVPQCCTRRSPPQCPHCSRRLSQARL